MRLNRHVRIQLAIFITIALTAFTVMALGYVRLPTLLFGIGHYAVTLQLPETGGLYERSNVTYRGTEVGQVKSIHLTRAGADAVLSLRSDVKIPSDLDAEVHSQSAIGEQYVALLPRTDHSAPLKSGDVIPRTHTSVPPDINELLDATDRGLQAIPGGNLNTVVDEAFTAFGGLGPEISHLVKGSTALAIDAKKNLADLTNVVDNVAPVLDTQTTTADSVQSWAAHLANITEQLQSHDAALRGVIQKGAPAAEEVRALLDRLSPTLPIVLANLVSVGDVAITYRADLEQLLVLLPQGAADFQAISVPNRSITGYKGGYLSFNLNLNIPPPCTTGFLPPQQERAPVYEDFPDRPAGDLYCRVPQDAMFNVRGARNTPCETRPGKRAPTVKMCESDENYVPLNDGYNWKGDPNATMSGQPIPQTPVGAPSAREATTPPAAVPPPIAAAEYDPATGTYIGPDGRSYTQANLSHKPGEQKSWQTMILPPTRN